MRHLLLLVTFCLMCTPVFAEMGFDPRYQDELGGYYSRYYG
jgi:hypothetical protein